MSSRSNEKPTRALLSSALRRGLPAAALALALPACIGPTGVRYRTWPAEQSAACVVGNARGRFGAASLGIEVGGAARLTLPSRPGGALRWSSSQPGVADVYDSGVVVALQPGTTWITGAVNGRSAAQCAVSVVGSPAPWIDPRSLRQYQDDRRFEIDGRVCFGSELNGQRAATDEERALVVDNRVINPTPLDSRHALEWEVEEGTTIVDGAGVLMGTVAPTTATERGRRVPSAKFNFGMSKVLGGRLHLYAFAVKIRPSPNVRALAGGHLERDGTLRTSAWLPIDSVVDRDTLVDRVGLGKVKLPRLPLQGTAYRITGGDPSRYMTEHGELRIVRDPHAAPVPSHYLRRPSGTVNIIYSVPGFGLGGQGLDSFLVTDGVIFRPAVGARPFVRPTFYPARHPARGRPSRQTMTFIYGAAEAPGVEPVYGWVALEALEAAR